MTDRRFRVRFAPSPTGSLHVGNARTALFNWLVARQSGGTVVLRIEDTDTGREQEGSVEGILEDLLWLGLDWDEGPGVGGRFGPYRQSERGDLYASAAERLRGRDRVYRCFCSDEEIAAARREMREAGRASRYPGTCADLPREVSDRRAEAGEPYAERFRIAARGPGPSIPTVRFRDRFRGVIESSTADLGDPVVVRRDGRPTYNFAVVVDDASMDIDLVLRGDDHLSNTPVQVLLYEALDERVPEFAHLPMVRGADGARLSKRHGAVSVAEYRRDGYPVDGLVNALALLGWGQTDDREVLTRDDLVREFDLDRVSLSPSTFDRVKLDWLAGQHVQRMPAPELAAGIAARLVEDELLPDDAADRAGDWMVGVAEMLRTKIDYLGQVPERAAGLFSPGGRPEKPEARDMLTAGDAGAVLEALAGRLEERDPTDAGDWKRMVGEVREGSGARGKKLFMPIRVALTGSTSGPELDRLVPLAATGSRLFPRNVPAPAHRVRRTLEWLR